MLYRKYFLAKNDKQTENTMFDKDSFIEKCKELASLEDGHKKIKELLESSITDTTQIIDQLGKPSSAGFEILYHSDELTIINFVWAPGMELHAHNHNIWAVIGIYSGAEENTFYVRKDDTIVKQNVKNLSIGDVTMLGENVIHSVRNTTNDFTGGIHIYGGDFVDIERSEWDMENFQESPYDMEHTRQVFAEANKKLAL